MILHLWKRDKQPLHLIPLLSVLHSHDIFVKAKKLSLVHEH